MKQKLFQALVLALLIVGLQKKAYGACSVTATGGSIASSCSFTFTSDGVDAGTGTTNTAVLTIPNAVQLTILSGQTIAAGSFSVASGGSINIISGGVIKVGQAIWNQDADSDGYPTATTLVQATQPGGYVRRNTVTNWTLTDCDDTTNTKWQNQTAYTDVDEDGYGTGTSLQVCSGIFPPVGFAQCGPGTCAGHMRNITDCAPSDYYNFDLVDLYADADGDGYTVALPQSICMGNWYGVPVGYQESPTNPMDCYDSNANAKPGQCTYFGVHRGDGSFNYDCVERPNCSSGCAWDCGLYQTGDRDFEIPWIGGCWSDTATCGTTYKYRTYAGWINGADPICGQNNTYCQLVDCTAACNSNCSSVFTNCK